MEIRKATFDDMPAIAAIYAHAREQMRRSGNPNQWRNRPTEEDTLGDIEGGNCYVVWDGEPVGVFAFIVGEDKTYEHIDGKWLNDERYGTIHRLASSGKRRGIFECVLDFCMDKISNIRADTHKDNAVMRKLLVKFGFTECGTIIASDGTPRIAFQRTSDIL